MRHRFYHTDNGKNAVFHNFAKCTHSIFRTIDRSTRGLLAKPLKTFPKSPIYAIYGQLVLTLQSELWSRLNKH